MAGKSSVANVNIVTELLVAQWDSLKVAWILLKEALERLNREDANQASTSHQ